MRQPLHTSPEARSGGEYPIRNSRFDHASPGAEVEEGLVAQRPATYDPAEFADSQPQPLDGGLVAALNGLDAGRERALANRTRRAVHGAAVDIGEDRHVRRRSFAIVVLTLVGLLMLLSPAIWNSVDEMVGGEFLLDVPGMVAALAFTLFAAVAAVLFLVSGRRGVEQPRH